MKLRSQNSNEQSTMTPSSSQHRPRITQNKPVSPILSVAPHVAEKMGSTEVSDVKKILSIVTDLTSQISTLNQNVNDMGDVPSKLTSLSNKVDDLSARLDEISEIRREVEEVRSELSDVKHHISEVQGKSTDATTSLETKCASLEKDMSAAKTNYDQLSRDLNVYKNKVVWMEAQSRCDNLIIDGLKDDPTETHVQTVARVRQIFAEKIGLANANTISIVRAHRH